VFQRDLLHGPLKHWSPTS